MIEFELHHVSDDRASVLVTDLVRVARALGITLVPLLVHGDILVPMRLQWDSDDPDAVVPIQDIFKDFQPLMLSGEQLTASYAEIEGGQLTRVATLDGGQFNGYPPGFVVVFSEELTLGQVKGGLEALAAYYRAVGGLGFEISFEFQDVESKVPVHA